MAANAKGVPFQSSSGSQAREIPRQKLTIKCLRPYRVIYAEPWADPYYSDFHNAQTGGGSSLNTMGTVGSVATQIAKIYSFHAGFSGGQSSSISVSSPTFVASPTDWNDVERQTLAVAGSIVFTVIIGATLTAAAAAICVGTALIGCVPALAAGTLVISGALGNGLGSGAAAAVTGGNFGNGFIDGASAGWAGGGIGGWDGI
ncbi:hypothetical protein [Subtercola sp. RTI3]|uniref:hypothetical protein n=1 Tax=Subtercola sp. RTI3 TaxID=3048639 RepID=UPI002B236E74|nr:hypothetical protein [Subtercola sp. RTI3]MEA9985774.1 hypothetical protein [Subtercola sp. RTI3]